VTKPGLTGEAENFGEFREFPKLGVSREKECQKGGSTFLFYLCITTRTTRAPLTVQHACHRIVRTHNQPWSPTIGSPDPPHLVHWLPTVPCAPAAYHQPGQGPQKLQNLPSRACRAAHPVSRHAPPNPLNAATRARTSRTETAQSTVQVAASAPEVAEVEGAMVSVEVCE
jgi:hypothetical protein